MRANVQLFYMNSIRNQLEKVNKSMSIQQSSQSSKSSVSNLRALVSLSVSQSVLKVLCFKKTAKLSDGPVQAGALGLDFYLTCQSSLRSIDLISRSQIPPKWEPVGGLKVHLIPF